MHPAPSVIVFTVLSGLGFGFLIFLGIGLVPVRGFVALVLWGLGYGLAVAGLVASTFHLGQPLRALLAFRQWRSSWLSREAWAAMLALIWLAPMALSDWLWLEWPRLIGCVGAAFALATVGSTAMIYTQIRAVPRWNNVTVPAVFLSFSLAGGAMLAGLNLLAVGLLLALSAAVLAHWVKGDSAFARAGSTLGTATGLGTIGTPQVFELPHTGGNYLLREMIHVVARRHVMRLRAIALICAALLPAVALVVLPPLPALVVALPLHVLGALAQRWLFFAQAEHVVGLYYGKR
jgi:sulfite dehydrogenase (quinone) subunit SoeC